MERKNASFIQFSKELTNIIFFVRYQPQRKNVPKDWLRELQLSSDSELQLLAILHIDLIIQRPLAKCILYLNLICHCNHPPSVIIIIIITIHLYSLLVFVINIVVLCLVNFHA